MFKLSMHVGGKMEFKPQTRYVGGDIFIMDKDVDRMSMPEIKWMLSEIGYERPSRCWYGLPGKSIRKGLVEILLDADVCRMAELGVKNEKIDMYCETEKLIELDEDADAQDFPVLRVDRGSHKPFEEEDEDETYVPTAEEQSETDYGGNSGDDYGIDASNEELHQSFGMPRLMSSAQEDLNDGESKDQSQHNEYVNSLNEIITPEGEYKELVELRSYGGQFQISSEAGSSRSIVRGRGRGNVNSSQP